MRKNVKADRDGSGFKNNIEAFFEKLNKKAVVALTLVVAFVFTFLLNSIGVIPLDALFTRARVSVSGNAERFPLDVDTESTLVIDNLGDSIIILTTENVMVFSANGKQLVNQPHVYAKPGVSLNGERAVVFDRGGKGYMLINKDEIVYEGTADNNLLSAEYGEDGNYALGTKGSGATSTLTVYNKKHKVVFQWNCAHEYIASITLADNGRYAGVAVIGAENGQVFTTVHYFGFDYKDTLNTQKIVGVAPLSLEHTKFNELTLITDKGVYLINRKSDTYQTASSYYSSEFNSCDFADNNKYVVALAKYGSENVFELNVFSKSGKLSTTISADFEIKGVRMSNKYIFALGTNKIMVYNLRGKNVSEIAFKGEAYNLIPTDDFIFIYSLDKINRCFSYGDATIELGA